MSVEQIPNLQELILLPPNTKILKHEVTRLTAPGDNYGSLMLGVEITVQDSENQKVIHVAAKAVPPDPRVQEIFNTKVTFRNEIEFYKTIVPLMKNFQKENGVEKVISFAPKYLGSRLNLNGSGEVDGDGVLLLENLKNQNYRMWREIEGFDLKTTEMIIEHLGEMHGVSLGLKLKKPKVFKKQILPFLETWHPKGEHANQMKQGINNLIDQVDSTKPYKERILTGFEKQSILKEVREPFGTLVHNDCWVNNYLVQFDGTTVIKTKMVDYQVCSYGSPARDIVFFLFSSVKAEILQKHYNNLLKKYHQILLSTLKSLNCDTTPFTFEALEKEIELEARDSQFGHTCFMLFPILAKKSDNFSVSDLFEGRFSDELKKRFAFVVHEFVKKNWV